MHKLVHMVNFNTAVQALTLLFQILDSRDSVNDRYGDIALLLQILDSRDSVNDRYEDIALLFQILDSRDSVNDRYGDIALLFQILDSVDTTGMGIVHSSSRYSTPWIRQVWFIREILLAL
jgi:hypothetical protein